MRLSQLLKGIAHEQLGDASAVEIKKITSDSRKVEPGDLFVAIKGTITDGHNYIDQAVKKGAVAILCEELPDEQAEHIAYIRAEHTDVILGELAANYYDHPSEKLKLIGVTGTNGKTTIATLLYRLFKGLGYKVGLISTVCVYIDDEVRASERTTPDALTLQCLLNEMRQAGCSYVFMEVSSHAVCQHRIGGAVFVGGIFTNITHDHLDYHGTFLNYLKAKQGFFDGLCKEAFALTNIDEPNGGVMVQNSKADIHTYGLKRDADFKGKILEQHLEGTDMLFGSTEVFTHFVGNFNAYNLLAVYGAAMLLGADKDEVLRLMSTLRPVDGRFQTILSPKGYVAVVDYAHTPDALENVLTTLTDLIDNTGGRLITVVGCGGNRDQAKRPVMAAISAKHSDLVILTSDNPRDEDPVEIIRQMQEGLDVDAAARTLSITDRREAIRTACTMAIPKDIILIAGKGHETYQEIKGVKHHFSDFEIVTEITSKEKPLV
ncbi:UDP-N-acetylmuramoyl-L-alanyl-D-glutamate--2,6-diaminopimelate ligase [Porphyromonas cangingivalis]|uniref:UDP-N-acetylmuramoyl-L-alanyl-D-glutamate--2,6-diaminopimelate ligase n=1 Tax=Porphyromonas cangingivalis TaxID=36874 RepID=A0A1T4MNL2_PORCN|nr:UDP-N-acetylmuramoyl-L-alanyl-D-glutamate--2,6-diaminopimelate ligase [Porphyromonas cangingivalis]SJZ68308.1 UDP-N-acetylmuramoylalanyl-D-glutamate--2,6-diaminopimelate ligase [Porphyromonas cangingivalis]VEJ03718.1 UDP-N-acetylmuramoyl-L-alanyl-D-glutamate--LD-lysine ligase [Porphyromonas cangingivalis]